MRFYTFFLFICIQPKVKNAQKEANQYMIGPYVGQANYQQSHTACLHMSLQKSLSINAVKGRTEIVIQKINRTACWQLSNRFSENITKKTSVSAWN